MRSQVSALALAVEQPSPALAALDLPLLQDPRRGHCGPLGGLLSALRYFGEACPWLLVAPCDSPFLPEALGSKLLACADAEGSRAACIILDGVPQPQHSLWHRDLLPLVERAVLDQGEGGLKAVLGASGFAGFDWPGELAADEPPPFFNVNDRRALARAEHWLDKSRRLESC
jgi:molybdopterin-guanine dinucleotide biosynthesis protein A